MTPLGREKEPGRFRWRARVSRNVCWVVLLVSCFLVGGARGFYHAWQVNLVSLNVLRGVDNECEASKSVEWVLCAANAEKRSRSPMLQDGTDCQQLWQSRVQASESLTIAQETLDQITGCAREELVSAWGGQLAWLQNDRQRARQWWQNVRPGQIINWGYVLLIQGRTEEARFLLDLALEQGGPDLSRLQRVQLLSNLGYEARLAGKWSQASAYYQDALELAPEDADIHFRLGSSLRQDGQPQEAVRILENGLEHLPLTYYEFVSDYQVQLGQAYRESGKAEEALEAFQKALRWLAKVDSPSSEKRRMIDRLLDQSQKSLEGNP